MNAPSAAAILSEVEDHLAEALALLDRHRLGIVATPHIDLGLFYVRDALAKLSSPPQGRSAH
jgi:hypothetical protein